MPRIALLVALVWAAAACKERNPEYCDTQGDCPAGATCRLVADGGLTHICILPDGPPGDGGPADAGIPCSDAGTCPSDVPICRPDNLCRMCAPGSAECPAERPICDGTGRCGVCGQSSQCAARDAGTAFCQVDAGACVECLGSATCPGARPVCAGGACRTCRKDSECSTLCDLDTGQCVDPADILYVSATATTADCTLAKPCASVTAALAKTRTGILSYILIADGNYAESLVIADRHVVLVGVPGVRLLPRVDGSTTVDVGAAANVSLRNLEIAGGTPGVHCAGPSAAGSIVRLSDATVSGTSGIGVDASACTLTVERTIIKGSGQTGLNLGTGCVFDVHDSVVIDGDGAGVVLSQPARGTFDFNTVTRNTQGGVACISVSPTLAFKDDIVYGNGASQIFGTACTWSYSDIGPGTAPDGTGNLSLDPIFTPPTGYHISPTSPCVDMGDLLAPASPTDIDGDLRPSRARNDIGADEVSP